ncbi:MAG: hypothetical protein KA163_11185 [Bacteroidia bacterium]|nr:hypothetical protein [Bacteroidia bacterium]
MIYLTYNDQPSGIYNSQVIDVVKYLNSIQNTEKVKLVALISIRSFFKNKKLIQQRLPESKVLPMVPKPGLWRLNYFILAVFLSKTKIIMARGPFATSLALRLKKAGKTQSVIFDARGAYKAELNEYDVVQNETIKEEIIEIEKEVVLNSDFRLTVSNALVNYWIKEFNYNSDKHIVVPCTLSADFNFEFPSIEKIKFLRKEIGFSDSDVVIVYSGSSAGWQSFSLVEKMLTKVFEQNANVKLLWLTNHLNENSGFVKQFKNRIKTAWVKPEEVKNYLLAGDYGLLYRENSVTNQVASPVKFAEYLTCGLSVIISENLGDYSEFVKKNNCGIVGDVNSLENVSYETKQQNHKLATQNLTKENYKTEYLKLLQA